MKTRAPTIYVAEPSPAYLARSPVVIDCSVFGTFLFAEAHAESAREIVSGRELHAPWLLDHEIANVADKKRRAGVEAALIEAGIALYGDYIVTMHRTMPGDVLELAATYALSTYDAAYLAVAAALHMPLVTFDRKLAKAAMRHLGALE